MRRPRPKRIDFTELTWPFGKLLQGEPAELHLGLGATFGVRCGTMSKLHCGLGFVLCCSGYLKHVSGEIAVFRMHVFRISAKYGRNMGPQNGEKI